MPTKHALPKEVIEAQSAEELALTEWQEAVRLANEARNVAAAAAEKHSSAQRHTLKMLQAAVARAESK